MKNASLFQTARTASESYTNQVCVNDVNLFFQKSLYIFFFKQNITHHTNTSKHSIHKGLARNYQ